MREIAKSLSLRLTEEEYIALQARAKEYGLKIEPTVRRLIAEAKIESRPQEVYADMLCELSAIGKQINQIAYQANVQKGITDAEVNRAVALIQQVYLITATLKKEKPCTQETQGTEQFPKNQYHNRS